MVWRGTGSSIRWRKLLSLATHVSINSLIFSAGNLMLARSMGPTNRGEYTKLTLVSFVIALCAEMGATSSATHFSALGNVSRTSILKKVIRRQVIFATLFGFPTIVLLGLLNYFSIRETAILLLNLSIMSVTTGPSHIIQGLNLDIWKRLQLLQAMFYIPIFVFCYVSHSSPVTVFFILSISYLIPNGVALVEVRNSDRSTGLHHDLDNLKFVQYSRINWLWTLASQLSAKSDLLLISFFISAS